MVTKKPLILLWMLLNKHIPACGLIKSSFSLIRAEKFAIVCKESLFLCFKLIKNITSLVMFKARIKYI